MKTDSLKKLVELYEGTVGDERGNRFIDKRPLESLALDLAREVIALREAAGEVYETHMLTAGMSPEVWAEHCEALATLRAVLGEDA
jgi:hypothetical protein